MRELVPSPEALLEPPADTASVSAPVAQDSLTSITPTAAPAQRQGPRVRETPFVPGRPATLRGPRGRVTVEFPGNGFGRPLRLTTRPRDAVEPELRAAGQPVPPLHPNQRQGLGAFFLDATDPQGKGVHRFDAPFTLRVQYTDAQLRALGLTPGQLSLFWFNPELEVSRPDGTARKGVWVPIPTTIDADAHTATAQVDHFSAFQLGNGLSASAAFIPSLQGWQVDAFTGGATYSYPIDVPAGPGGLKPTVALSYASNADDGPGGARKKAQASWVGRGWSFDPGGAIARNKNSCCGNWDHFTLTAMGRSFDIVRGNHVSGAANDSSGNVGDLTQWNWHIANEAYWKIRANSTNTWTAWSPDGVRYEFTQPLVWGWHDPDMGTEWYEPYKWLLTSVVDPHDNRITFSYQVDAIALPLATIHPTYRLSEIRWGYDGATPGTGTARYRLAFEASSRWASPTETVDTQWDFATYQIYTNPYDPNAPGAGAGAPHESYRLNRVVLYSTPPGQSEQPAARWDLTYAASASSVTTDTSDGQRMLTLLSIAQGGYTPSTATWSLLPAATFTYGMSRGTAAPAPPTAGWNRLLTARNGYGGRITYTYGHIWSTPGYGGVGIPAGEGYYEGSPYAYRFRVLSLLQEDISGQSYANSVLTTYEYANPGLNTHEHAATVWYAQYPPGNYGGDSRIFLSRPEKSEFRGHEWVITRVYNGATTGAALLERRQSWFYQGKQLGSPCSPPLLTHPTDNYLYVDTASACFQTMQRNEAWKGRVYKEELQDAGGAALQRTEYVLGFVELPFYTSASSTDYRRAGLWRSFSFTSESTQTTIANGNSLAVRTVNLYDHSSNTNWTAGTTTTAGTYGNLSRQDTYVNGTRMRITMNFYTIVNSATDYMTDRRRSTATWDGNWVYQSFTAFFYDGQNTTEGGLGTRGLLTRESRFDIPGNYTSGSINGVNQTWTYDLFGNRLTASTYPNASTASLANNVWSFSAPSGTARVTTTTYDTVFRALPRTVTNPAGHLESATYDYRLGVLLSVTDANNQQTTAAYDPFGRLVRLVQPGDTTASPTIEAVYYDTELPFRYEVRERDVANQSGASGGRVTQHWYDGLGRQIQTKVEASSGTTWQTIVSDTRYDGLGRVRQQSQPRYLTETSTSFYDYTAPPASGVRWTSTSYDLLGRITAVADPAGYQTLHRYGVVNDGGLLHWHEVENARGNKVEQRSDGLGRVKKVLEELPGGGANTTTYVYDARDLLTQVTDPLGNLTTLSYNSLGRKLTMSDPNMGVWSYAYDVNGNLTRQTDAKGQRICFYYDVLDRVTAKHARSDNSCPALSSNPALLASYSYDAGTNGVGRRTGMVGDGLTTTWGYDTRGRTVRATHSVTGVSGTREFTWSYDSANRVVTQSYPGPGVGVETVRYTYDAAWRQTSVCIDGTSNCYAGSGQYDALGQPTFRRVGNNLRQTWTYGDALARLTRLQVGTDAAVGSLFDRSYGYDAVGNLVQVSDNQAGGVAQRFRYDHRERLLGTSAIVGSGSTISIVARGNNVDGWPIMRLRVNGTLVKEWTVASATWASYSHTLSSAVNEDDTVDVEFVNNYSNGVSDRDLYVQSVTVGSQVIPATARTVSYDRNAVDGKEVFASDGNLWWSGALRLTELYSYDAVGNLTNKAGLTYSYGANGNGTGAGPYQARVIGGDAYSYDANGNLTSGGGRSYSWTAENMPSSIASGGVTESYAYSGDDARYKRVRGTTTTLYFEGLYEETVGGTYRRYYTLNGQVVGLREQSSTVNTLNYPHGDHLGSVSLVSSNAGALASEQEYDPWGKVRLLATESPPYGTGQPPVQQTRRNYTGQYWDDTGLLYYNARYYDPAIGRFVSADTVVPGVGGLTIWPSDAVAGSLFREGGKDQDGNPTAPTNPQTLNRYSYVENNPVIRTDPTGHCSFAGQFNGSCLNEAKAIVLHPNASWQDKATALAYVTASNALGAVVALGAYAGLGAIATAGAVSTAASEATVAASLSRVDTIRQAIDIGQRRNIAFADFSIGGNSGTLIGVSGQATRAGTVATPANRIFSTFATGNNSRMFDAEVKILEEFAARYANNRDIAGTINLFSERPLCPSCSGVVTQFREMFPNIALNVSSGP